MLKLNFSIMIAFLFVLLMSSCTKSNTDAAVVPANLMVYATPSTDGGGVVNFSATADNAVAYTFNFGTGDSTTNYTGNAIYQFTTSGTNTYTVTVTAKSSTGVAITKSVDVAVYVAGNSGKLVWADEFNSDGLPDTTKWGYDIGAGGWGNGELQYYTNSSANAYLKGGSLFVKAIKQSYNGSNYTSARLITKNKFAFMYGRVDVRAKLPIEAGTWPAIWMLGSNIDAVGWPNCGEIDIMEQKGFEPNKILGTLHYPGHFGGGGVGSATVITDAAATFHTYSLVWSPATIKILVDNQAFFTFANNASVPFNQNFFMILNVAMGGSLGGTVGASFTSAAMEVDYVRVYK